MIEKILFPYKKYKGMWEEQNSELDIQSAKITRQIIKINDLENEIKILKIELEDKKKTIDKVFADALEREKQVYSKMNKELEKTEEKRRKAAGKAGGLSKENKKLRKEIENLKEEVKKAMENKYIIKKLPAQKTPKVEPIKIRSHAKESKIIKDIKEI